MSGHAFSKDDGTVNMRDMPQSTSPVRRGTVYALICAALAVVAPFAVRGIACGHDLTFHMNSWMEVAQQWRQGVIYPRWAAMANYGGGEPRFLFYPPLSWMLGGALGSLMPWMFAPVTFDCCVVILAGLAMFRMASEWFDASEATLIAVAYAVNPYMLLTIYVRSAFGELLAASLLPLLLLWIVRDRPARQMFVPLALTVAGIWLTNVPAAIIASYMAILLLVVVTVLRRNSRVFVYGVCGMGLGMLLAAFFIVPVLYEKNWITLGQVLSAGVRPAENFLFSRTGEPQHDRFLRALSWLASGELAITGLTIVAGRSWRKLNPRLWWSLLALLLMTVLLMLPVMAWAYQLLPDLRFLQFPWRWMLAAGIAYAVFVVIALPSFRGKPWLYGLLFALLIAGCNLMLQPKCDPADTPFMIANVYHSGYGYMGTDEYVPAGGDNYEIKADFPEALLRNEQNGPAPAGARITQLKAKTYRKQLTVDSPQPVELVLRLMNYPAWRVTVNGAASQPQSEQPTGRMAVSLPAGHSEIEVHFARTIDRWIGDLLSLAALIFLVRFWYVGRRATQVK